MPVSVLTQNSLLNITSVNLGRLVHDKKNPHLCFLDPLIHRPSESEFVIDQQEDLEIIRNVSRASKLRFYLGKLFSISHKTENTGDSKLTASHIRTYHLKNSSAWFKEACNLSDTRNWLLESFNDRMDIYLVVGIRTLQDACMSRSSTYSRDRHLRARVPAEHLPIFPGMVGATAALNAISPTAVSSVDSGFEESVKFYAPGEQIAAVRYRRVKLRFLKAEETFLETEAKWKVYSDNVRGAHGSDDEGEALEAYLDDTSDLEDFDELSGGGDVNHLNETLYSTSIEKDLKNHSEKHYGTFRSTIEAKRGPENVGQSSKVLLGFLCLFGSLFIFLCSYRLW